MAPETPMSGEELEKKRDEPGKNPGASGESSQWSMHSLNKIDTRFDRIENDIRGLGTSIGNIKKVIWTAAGVIIAVGFIGTFLFGLGDLITKIPFEITIRNQPPP